MSRSFVVFAVLFATSAGCKLDAPLATACRTDDDCVGGNRCAASVCTTQITVAGSDGSSSNPTRAPNETPSPDDGGGLDTGTDTTAPTDGAGAGPDAAGGADAARAPDLAVMLPPDAAVVSPDAARVPPDAAVAPPDAAVVPPDAAPLRADTAVAPPDLAPDTAVPVDAPPLYTGDPCCVVAGLCGGTGTTPKNSGQVTIGPSTDLVPLCGGWVLHGDRAANQVVLRNVFSGMVKASYQLSTAPNRVLLDVARRLVLVSFGGATTALARIDLESGQVKLLDLAAPAKDIALSGGGQVLALTGTDPYSASKLEVIDELTGSSWSVASAAGFGTLLAYRPSGAVLYLGVGELSPSGLSRATLDWASMTVTPLDSLWNNGSNCHEVVLSDDGQHLAVPCGAGNSSGSGGYYTIFDRSADKLSTVLGEWMTGPYPTGAAFSPDGKYLASSDGQSIQAFSVVTHARLSSFPIPTCEYGNTTRVRISPDNAFAFALSQCGFSSDSARLTWNHLP
jgi:hypothetical protein